VESKLGPLGTAAIYSPIVPAPGDCEHCEDVELFGAIKTGRGNRSTRRKPAPAPLCPPKIPLDQTRDRTRAAAVGMRFSYFSSLSLFHTKNKQEIFQGNCRIHFPSNSRTHMKKVLEGTVKLCLCLITHYGIGHIWQSGGTNSTILHLDTRWRLVVSFTLRPLYRWQRTPGNHCIGCWMGPRDSLGDMEKRRNITAAGNRNLAIQLAARPYAYYSDSSSD
jgi:hypothetical protein